MAGEPTISFWQSNAIRGFAQIIVGQLIVLAVAFVAEEDISTPYLVATFAIPVLTGIQRMLGIGTSGDSPKVAPPTP